MLGATTVALWLFAVDDGGLVSTGQTGQWEWAVPTSGPKGTAAMWATNADGPYLHDTVDELTLTLPPLDKVSRPVLHLRHWYDIDVGDASTIEVDRGQGFARVDPVYGYPELAGFVGLSGGVLDSYVRLDPDTVQVRFVLAADEAFAHDGWYVEEIGLYDGDIAPPALTLLEAPTDTQDLDGPYLVQVHAVDDIVLEGVDLTYDVGTGPTTVPMTPDGDDVYTGAIPGQPPDTTVHYYVTASDGEQSARVPEEDGTFRVFLAAPTGLSVPAGRLVGTEVELSWTAPDTPHTVDGYTVYQDGAAVASTSSNPAATVSVQANEPTVFTVAGVYDVGEGDHSEALQVDLEIPRLDYIDPPSAFGGDAVHVDISGTGLYLDQSTASIDLGSGITVTDIDVVDAFSVRASIAIDPEATPGRRDLVVGGAHGDATFSDAFEVVDGEDRPHILSVTPPSIVQGETATHTFTASEPFFGPVYVQADEDLVVVHDGHVNAETTMVTIAAANLAAPGEHVLILDDGARLWMAVLEVEEYVSPPQKSCSHHGGLLPLWWLALGALGRRRGQTTA